MGCPEIILCLRSMNITMNEIICPHCTKAFKIDETGYTDIVKQIRDHVFTEELRTREEFYKNEKESAVLLAEERTKSSLKDEVAKRDTQIAKLISEKDAALAELSTKREIEIAELKGMIRNADTEKKLAVTEALAQVERERDQLANEVRMKENEKLQLDASWKSRYDGDLKAK